MKRHVIVICFLAVCFWSTPGVNGAELRTWTSKSGKFIVKAELLSFVQEVVSLRRTNGKTIKVPLAKLSEEDQQFLKLVELKAPAQAELEKGKLFFEKQDWDTAIVCFTEAIRLNPNYAKAYFVRGNMYEELGEKAKAAADYARAK